MLIDTSGLFCLLDEAEAFHSKAVSVYRAARTRLCHNYVLAEFIPLAQSRGFPRQKALSYLNDLHLNPDIDTVWVDPDLHREAVKLLVARPDKKYSLCDAVSFVLMLRRGITDALTTDKHFEQEGFHRLLAE